MFEFFEMRGVPCTKKEKTCSKVQVWYGFLQTCYKTFFTRYYPDFHPLSNQQHNNYSCLDMNILGSTSFFGYKFSFQCIMVAHKSPSRSWDTSWQRRDSNKKMINPTTTKSGPLVTSAVELINFLHFLHH